MPIKKQNFELYPHNWRKISWWVIHVRAQNHCEGTLENGERCNAENHKPHPETKKKVVLSVAHLDHNPANSVEENMKALCQRCHNRWDREHRNESIRQTYKEKHGEVLSTPQYYPTTPAAFVGKHLAAIELLNEDAKEELRIYESLIPEMMEEQIEKLKQTLQALLKEQIPQQEAYEYNVLLKSLELRDELLRLMCLPPDQLNTLQTQTLITIAKQKQGVIEQLISVNKMTTGMSKLLVRTPTPIPPNAVLTVPPLPVEEPTVNYRGLGIRNLIKSRNGTTTGTEPE